MRRVAAIDQGTTSTKLAILEADGRISVKLRLPHATAQPRHGCVEQDAEELLGNVRRCFAAAGPVAAVGIANQGESCLAWDAETGEPLSPVLVWQDQRTEALVGELRTSGVEAQVRESAGLPLDSYFSASKLGWLVSHLEPVAVAHRAGRLRLGTTDAFFLDRLAGRFVTDIATASRTSLMNIRTGRWDADLCRLFGVPIECLPAILPNAGAFGAVDGIPITAAIVDQQAALYGHGCRHPGDVKVTFGTGAFILAIAGSELQQPASGLFPTVAWRLGERTTYAIEGGVFDAGSAVDWARGLGLFQQQEELSSFRAPPAISRNLAFVPALSGLGCPDWDRRAGGLWIGLTGAHAARDLCQALLEGIALQVAEVLDAVAAHSGPSRVVHADGGLAGSDYLMQFLADVSGREVRRAGFHDVTCLGTAWLAAAAAGDMPDRSAKPATSFQPRPSDAAIWRERFRDAVRRSRDWH